MKCPYCAEEIKDEAVVCRHCSHDFSLIKPLLVRVIGAEKGIEELTNKPQLHELEKALYYSTFAAAVMVTLSILWTSGLYFVLRVVPQPTREIWIYMLIIALPPAVFGLLTGLSSGSRNITGYFLAGLLLGSFNLFFIRLLLAGPGGRFNLPLAILTFLLGQPFTFTSLTLLGNTLRSLSSTSTQPRPPRRGLRFWEIVDTAEERAKTLKDLTASASSLSVTLLAAYQMLAKIIS